ncbi:MAG: C40 family peptidase [Clostridiaceae bacterium]|mgnify:CR=1 FL=1|jgi:cell wall-associated NlpC family hydrolase|nr:C40 family peptidase [Clostridiaceae bacterium]
MVKSSLLRRCAEVLAALIIVVSTVVYASVGIKNAGNNSSMLAAANMADITQEDTGNLTAADNLVTFSQDDSLNDSNINTQAQVKNEIPVVSRGNSIKDDTQDNNASTQSNIGTEQSNIEAEQADIEIASTTEDELSIQVEQQEQMEPVTKYVVADVINVRSAPGAENEKLAELVLGDSVQVLQQHDEWLEIIIEDNVKGYIFAEFVADTMPVYKYVSIDTLNIRKGAGSDTDKIGTLKKGERIKVIGNADKWSKIITPDNAEGYVYTEYIADTPPPVYKYINAEALNIRKSSSSSSEKLGTIAYGNRVQVFEESGKYIRILTKDGIEGYVLKEHVVSQSSLPSRSSSNQSYNSELSSKIIEYAKTFVGVPYVYGGSTPNGFDCSGFTKYVLNHFNIKAPRSAHEYSSAGTSISRTDMKPGDVIMFDRYNNYRIGHVGIYLGNDKFIHASSSKGKVVIATLSKYSGNIMGIRRFAK